MAKGIPKLPQIPMKGISNIQMPSNIPLGTFNPQSFEKLIAEMGIRLVHARPIPSPRVKDIRGDDLDPSDNQAENGFFYYGHKDFTGTFMSNSLDRRFNVNGTFDADQAVIVIPTKYGDGTEMDIQIFDRIIAPDLTVRYYQRVEHDQTGIDRLHFPAVKVDFIMDAHDRQYAEGVDFVVDNKGRIEWLQGGQRPGYDPVSGSGIIYSVNYYCRPVFTVISLPHQLRATQTRGPGGPGTANVQNRYPQLAVVRKDFVPFDPNDQVGPRTSDEPDYGSVRGPRR